MAIIKTRRTTNFTTLPNELLNDSRLKWADLGLLVHLLSKPESWVVRIDVVRKARSTSKDAIYASLKRIREIGYAKVTRNTDGTTEWIIFDKPNPDIQEMVDPHPENPDPENPDQENQDVYKKKSSSNERVLVNIKEKINKKEKSDPIREELSEVTDQTFDDFIQLRKAKRSPLTLRAIQGIRNEANKAGIPLETALIECCTRGWVGFKAEWYVKPQAPPQLSKQQIAHIAARSIFGNDNEEILINGEVIEYESTTKQLG